MSTCCDLTVVHTNAVKGGEHFIRLILMHVTTQFHKCFFFFRGSMNVSIFFSHLCVGTCQGKQGITATKSHFAHVLLLIWYTKKMFFVELAPCLTKSPVQEALVTGMQCDWRDCFSHRFMS